MLRFFCTLIAILNLALSTSHSQEIFIPYRKGPHWGYADTLGKIVIAPVYDQVSNGWTVGTNLKVSKDMKWGVVSRKNKVLVPLKHDHVANIHKGYIVSEDKTEGYAYLHGLYNHKGTLLIPPEDQSIDIFNSRIIFVRSPRQSKRSGVALLNSKGTKLTWIVPRVNEDLYFRNGDSVLVVETGSKVIEYKVSRAFVLKKIKESDADPFEDDHIVEVASEERPLYGGPVREARIILSTDFVINAEGKKTFLLKKTQMNSHDQDGPVLTDCEKINIVQYPNGGKETYFRDKTRWISDHWAIAHKNEKYGAYFPVPESTVIPFEYDSITKDIIPYKCKTVLVKAKRNGKWGLIDRRNRVVTGFIFDDIIFPGHHFYGANYTSCFNFDQGLIVRSGDRYNVLRDSATVVYPPGFDLAIDPERARQGIRVFDSNKKGLYYSGHLFRPSYDGDGEFGDIVTSRFPLAQIVDKNKKLLGYVDKKGIVYFSN
jgi:hypothetical protein